MNETNARLQKEIDKKIGLQIAPQKADFPAERVAQIAKALTDPTVPPETIQRRARVAVENVAKSFHDNYVKVNAEFRSKAGIKCYIVREASGDCCEWCSSLAGRYVYGEEPDDVYHRHNNCPCTTAFENGRERQNVWKHKEKWQVTPVLKIPYKPLVLNRNQAENLQKIQLAKYKNSGNGLTSVANSGKIETERAISFKKVDKAIEYAKNKLSVSADALSTLPVEKVNVILSHISRLYAKMPVLDGFVDEIVLEKMSEIAKASIKWNDGKPLVRLKLSSSIFSNRSIDEIEFFIADAVENKDFSPKEGLYGVLKHEFAHMAEYSYTLKRYNYSQTDVSKSLDNFEFARQVKELALKNCGLEDNDAVIRNYISKYAIESPAEFIAEAYSSTADNKLINETKRILKRKWGI